MTIAWRALTGLPFLVLAGCGGTPEPDPKDPEGAVRIMFEGYMDALADGDWERACTRTAPALARREHRRAAVTGRAATRAAKRYGLFDN